MYPKRHGRVALVPPRGRLECRWRVRPCALRLREQVVDGMAREGLAHQNFSAVCLERSPCGSTELALARRADDLPSKADRSRGLEVR